MKRFKKIHINNLESPENFRKWIKENISVIYENKQIPNKHLLIFLDYIDGIVENEDNIDKVYWLKKIRDLSSNIKVLIEAENEL